MKFTEKEVATMVSIYNEVKDKEYAVRTKVVENLASDNKVSVPVIRGVLVAAGAYKAKEAKTPAKAGKKKEDVLAAIDAFMGITVPSFKNASAKDLNIFWDRLVEMSDRVNLAE